MSGIYFESKGGKESCFDDLLHRGLPPAPHRPQRHLRCLDSSRPRVSEHEGGIRGLLEDIGGDGINPLGAAMAPWWSITSFTAGACAARLSAGIWPLDCDDTLIQFNEVSGMKARRTARLRLRLPLPRSLFNTTTATTTRRFRAGLRASPGTRTTQDTGHPLQHQPE